MKSEAFRKVLPVGSDQSVYDQETPPTPTPPPIPGLTIYKIEVTEGGLVVDVSTVEDNIIYVHFTSDYPTNQMVQLLNIPTGKIIIGANEGSTAFTRRLNLSNQITPAGGVAIIGVSDNTANATYIQCNAAVLCQLGSNNAVENP